MEFTGERLVPDAADLDLWNEHFARYCFAEAFAAGKRVLDAGCGAGYGTARLAAVGAQVFGLDLSGDAVRHARRGYPAVDFVQGDLTHLPFPEGSLDLVVAFEVIEHLREWPVLIHEAARVLAESGVLVVSTPNRSVYEESREVPNPFHVHEFACEEFRGALARRFRYCSVFLENHVPAVAVTSSGAGPVRAHIEDALDAPEDSSFFVGVCSRQEFEVPEGLVYVPEAGNVLRERERHIRKLRDWVAELEQRHAVIEGRMSEELKRLPYRILRRLGLAPKLPRDWGV